MQRKNYSPEFKQQAIKEVREVGNCSLVARKYNIAHSIVNKWVRGSGRMVLATPLLQCRRIISRYWLRTSNSKSYLGKKELEIEILRDLLKKTSPHLKIK